MLCDARPVHHIFHDVIKITYLSERLPDTSEIASILFHLYNTQDSESSEDGGSNRSEENMRKNEQKGSLLQK